MTDEVRPERSARGGRRSRAWKAIVIFLVLVAVAGGSFWAGRVALVPPTDPLDEPAAVTYTVAEGVVGRTVSIIASARWTTRPTGTNGAAGVVTTVDIDPGTLVTPGTRLYSVDLRPVVAAAGAVPSFRDLAAGAEGVDVAQLEALLVEVGASTGEPDSRFDAATGAAVRRWQASLGVPADGIVRVGDVVYVPDLPARLALAPELAPGARLGGGESAVLLLSDTPEVRVLLTADMRSDVTAGAGVRIDYGSGTWEGAVADVVAAEEPGMFEAIVVGEDGGAVCADDCATVLPIDRDVQLPGEVIVVPERRGPVVPTAAIRTDAVNKPFVVTADGRRLPVEIIASSRGVAVVSGVEPGEVVNLVGQTTAPSTP